LILRITAQGNRSFVVRARVKGKKQPIRLTYKTPAHNSVLEEARAWAVEAVGLSRRGTDPREDKACSEAAQRAEAEKHARNRFGTVLDQFLEKYSSKNKSHGETKRIVNFYLRPGWDKRQIGDIGRRDIVERLDSIAEGKFIGKDQAAYGGPVMATNVLAQLRKLMNWHAIRDAEFISPIVPGMGYTKPRERARKRVLSDEEIRQIWPHLSGTYGAALKTLFYTAQRLGEVGQMRRAQIGQDSVWSIPVEAYKSNHAQFVPLTNEALAVIHAQPEVDGSDLVFPAQKDPTKQITNWSALKANLDAKITSASNGQPLPHWTVHDIRRTCRTLMSRAGIRSEISERVLGHAIPGVAGVYDQHDYLVQKREALEALAGELEHILQGNVSTLLPCRAEQNVAA